MEEDKTIEALKWIGSITIILIVSVFVILCYTDGINFKKITNSQWWIIGLCLVTMTLVLCHLCFIIFNLDSWKEKRNHDVEKWKSKRLSKLISSNEFDKFITELSEEQRALLKSKL